MDLLKIIDTDEIGDSIISENRIIATERKQQRN